MATKKTTTNGKTKAATMARPEAEIVIDIPAEKGELTEVRPTQLVTIEEETGVTCARVDFNNFFKVKK